MYIMFFCRRGESDVHLQTVANEDTTSTDDQSPQEQPEKRLRGLKKKLQQIEKLKSKQDEGEVLEDSQVMLMICSSMVGAQRILACLCIYHMISSDNQGPV